MGAAFAELSILVIDHCRKPDRLEVTPLMSAFPKHLKNQAHCVGGMNFLTSFVILSRKLKPVHRKGVRACCI